MKYYLRSKISSDINRLFLKITSKWQKAENKVWDDSNKFLVYLKMSNHLTVY